MNSKHSLYRTGALGALVLGLLLAPIAVFAQIVTPVISTGEEEKDTWVSVSYQHLFKTDTDLGPVDIEREAMLALAGHRFKLGGDWGLLTQAAYQLTDYNFSSDAGTTLSHWRSVEHRTEGSHG